MRTNPTTEKDLIQSYLDGELSAINELIDTNRYHIYNYIFFMVNNEDLAAEMYQETYFKVLQALNGNKYVNNGKFKSWVMRIAHNVVIDYYRKQKQGRFIISESDYDKDVLYDLNYSENNTEKYLESKQTIAEVRYLISLLPPEQRDIIRYRFYDELSFNEIAELSDTNVNTALGRMRYALMNLRKIIKEKEAVETAVY